MEARLENKVDRKGQSAMGRLMVENSIKINSFPPYRHSCSLLAGIHALKTRFPIQDFGNDGFLGVWSGKSL